MKKIINVYHQGLLLIVLLLVVTIARAEVYVSNANGGKVSIINSSTNTVITSPAVGNEPRNLAAGSSGTLVYVPNRFSNSVSVISTSTHTVVATITDASFDEPYAVAAKGGEIWVANKKGGGSLTGSVTIINAGTNTVSGVVNDVCFSSPESIATNPVQARAYVINRGNNTVCVVDTGSRTVIGAAITVGSSPRYAVVTPSGAFVYVANNSGLIDVTKINTADNSTTTIATGGFPRNMDISAAGDKVYVALQSSNIAVINTADDSVNTISFTGANSTYGVAIMPGSNRGYVTDESGAKVFVFDVTTETEITGPGLPISGSFSTPRAIAATIDGVSAPVPTLSQWALIMLGLMIALMGVRRLRLRTQG